MPFIQQHDFAMHYKITGTGPEIIILIHGNIASTRWWDKYLACLPHGYRAIAMDLRGCGRSGRPHSGYTIDQFAADIQFLVEGLELKKFHLLGHSMGGQIALYYALQHPQLVQTLTLLDSVPATGLALDDTARAAFDLLMTDKAVLQQAVDACMQYSSDREFALSACDDAFRCAPNIFKDNPGTMHQTVLLEQAGSITAPILIIHGREDLIIPLATMASTIQAMPSAQVVIFDNCGHSPQIEQTARFSDVYNNFINQHPINQKEV
jgi:branched-chain amino acid transport system permease protein